MTPSPVSASAAGPSSVTVILPTKKLVAATLQPSGRSRSSGTASQARAWQSDEPPPEKNIAQTSGRIATASAARASASATGKAPRSDVAGSSAGLAVGLEVGLAAVVDLAGIARSSHLYGDCQCHAIDAASRSPASRVTSPVPVTPAA